MTKCKSLQSELGACVYEPMSGEIEQHLEKCSHCRAHLRSLQQTRDQIASLLPQPDQALADEVKAVVKARLTSDGSTRKPSILLAAAASILLALGVWGIYRTNHTLVPTRTKIVLPALPSPYRQMESELTLLSCRGLNTIKSGSRQTVEKNKPTGLGWLSRDGLQYLKYGTKGRNF